MIRKLKHLIIFCFERLPFFIKYPIHFRIMKRRWPRLIFPKDYSDFIARDNFWGNHNKHAFLADKLEVRKYVEKKGLGYILVPIIGSWDDASKINFNLLPNQFAIKCNHSSGMNIVCYDKSKLDIEKTRKQLNTWLHTKHPIFFEQHYQHIKPMILCEHIIPSNADGYFPMDFKIHCANGKPVFIQCCFERTFEEGSKMALYSPDWQKLDYIAHTSHYSSKSVDKPTHLEDMLKCASILSQNLRYARVDLYDTDAGVIFGEITLTPQGGWLFNFTQDALDLMGAEIKKG